MSPMADQAIQRATISVPRPRLFETVTDFEHYTDWVHDLKAADVVSRDSEGRAVEVRYRAAAMGRSTSYTLHYDYSNAPASLPWKLVEGDIMRRLDGSYSFNEVPDDPEKTDVVYRLTVE